MSADFTKQLERAQAEGFLDGLKVARNWQCSHCYEAESGESQFGEPGLRRAFPHEDEGFYHFDKHDGAVPPVICDATEDLNTRIFELEEKMESENAA